MGRRGTGAGKDHSAFVEFTGSGLSQLGLADRATISNMCPEYGATAALFPIDDETLRYLRLTGRTASIGGRSRSYILVMVTLVGTKV